MTENPIVWHWGDVDASMRGPDVALVHRYAGARLIVRQGRLVRDTGYANAPPATRREVARVGAIVRLRQRGRYFVHAAGVVDPLGRACLLTGDSGSGKSTLAYALARFGWKVLGDDGVLISVTPSGITAHAWHAPLEVSSSLAGEFPELRTELSRARTGDPRRRIPIGVPREREARLAAVLFVERAVRHAIEPLGPVVALGALVRQSPWVILDDDCTRLHLDALRAVATLPSYRLAHTRADLHTIARTLAAMLS
jgi:hypothetical protein